MDDWCITSRDGISIKFNAVENVVDMRTLRNGEGPYPKTIIKTRSAIEFIPPGVYAMSNLCDYLGQLYGMNYCTAKGGLGWLSGGPEPMLRMRSGIGAVRPNFACSVADDVSSEGAGTKYVEILPPEAVCRASAYIYRGNKVDFAEVVSGL